MNENKTKIFLSAETEMCPYWDTESNRPTHTCHDCAEPDNHLSVMIEGVRYCLLDFDIAGEICRRNVPDTNVGKKEYIDRQAAIDAIKRQMNLEPADAIRAIHAIQKVKPADVEEVTRCERCRATDNKLDLGVRVRCDMWGCIMHEGDFCSLGKPRKEKKAEVKHD